MSIRFRIMIPAIVLAALMAAAILTANMLQLPANSIDIRQFLLTGAGLGLAGLAVLYLVLRRVVKRVTRQLNSLTALAGRAGATGNMALTEEEARQVERIAAGKDEVGALGKSFAAFVLHVGRVSDVLSGVAANDLTAGFTPLSEEDTLGFSLRKMTGNLNGMFRQIHDAAGQVATGAGQIADGAQSLAQGSARQTAAIDALSLSMRELAEQTRANADMAERATRLSDTVRGGAQQGSRRMDDMLSAVKEINEASHAISKVIKTIDDIAFRTNILALNAAVEAARAGAHGKGFAVVAQEVRSLAAKSAEAAKETEKLIADSMQKAELGVKIADATSVSLTEIVAGVNESGGLVADIAQSSRRQSAGILNINKSVDQVSQVVHQNSATAEQSAAASQQMSAQSAALRELVDKVSLANA